MECFRLVFSCLLTLEKGVTMDTVGLEGQAGAAALVHSGMYMGLSDSPFTAKLAYAMGQSGKHPCHACMFDKASMATPDQVRVGQGERHHHDSKIM